VSKTFCVLPWIHLATNASGNLRVCCNSTPGKNMILKPDGTPYKLWRDDLYEAWHSDTYKEIRAQMLAGERPEMCQRCFREEDVGIKSARQSWNQKWQEARDYPASPPMDIKYVDLRLGNLCNLRCRMCNPYASNQWVDEWQALTGEDLGGSEINRLKYMDWPENPKTWENLFSIVDSIDEIYLTGGEPTIIREQHKLLDHVIERGIAKDIKLKYNTNLTNVPRHLLSKWEEFRNVQLNCSIDATGALDRYIRYPSNWNKIVENFEAVNKLDNGYVEVHCTVQMYNITRLHELIEWAEPYGYKIYFNILNHPECLNIRVIDQKLKEQVSERLTRYTYLDRVQGVIDYMNSEDWSHLYPEFVRYTEVLDESRDENGRDLLPELFDESIDLRK